jgi:hypothetical protein
MKRTALVAATTILSLLMLLPGTGSAATRDMAGSASMRSTAASQPPQFTGYLQCFNGHVFTDFTDPDGDDTRLSATLAVFRASVGDWTLHPMTNTGESVHGVFFFIKLSDQGIDPADVNWYAVGAFDEAGDWSGWTMADKNCQVV